MGSTAQDKVWVDLHCHSLRSDGTWTPTELAVSAKSRALALFSLTDHDSIAGYDELAQAYQDASTFCSLELSCREYGRSVHVLLYNIPERARASLAQELAEIRKARVERVYKVCERLESLGVPIDPEDILSRTAHGTPGRPHIAAALVRAKACPNLEQAFARYLRDGGPADVPMKRLSIQDGLVLGRAHGAKMSMAHPHVYNSPALVQEMLSDYRKEGLEGLECYTAMYGENQRKRWAQMADAQGCVATAGSDFHGDNKKDVTALGVAIPRNRAEALSEWLDVALSI